MSKMTFYLQQNQRNIDNNNPSYQQPPQLAMAHNNQHLQKSTTNRPPSQQSQSQPSQSPNSPYIYDHATPTTAHQQSHIRYQQQQQQPIMSYTNPVTNINILNNNNRSPQQQQQQPVPNIQQSIQPYYSQHTMRSPSTSPTVPIATSTSTLPQQVNNNSNDTNSTNKPLQSTQTATSYSSDSQQNTPGSQSRLSPTIGSEFPDTPALITDKQQNVNNVPSIASIPSINTDDVVDDNINIDINITDINLMINDIDNIQLNLKDITSINSEEDAPIPSDEKSSLSITAPPLLPAPNVNDQAIIQQISQMALDDVNHLTMDEIDEEYQLEPTQRSDNCQSPILPSISRPKTTPLHIQADAPLLPPRNTSLIHYNTTGHQSQSPPVSNNNGRSYLRSPPRIFMPTKSNIISSSSTAITPSTGAALSPITPNRNRSSGTAPYKQSYSHNRHPLNVTTTPNTYQYRQSRYKHSHANHNNHVNNPITKQQSHSPHYTPQRKLVNRTPPLYAQTPNIGSFHILPTKSLNLLNGNGNTLDRSSSIPPIISSSTASHNNVNNIAPINISSSISISPHQTHSIQHHHPQQHHGHITGSQTPGTNNYNRLRSKSVSITTTSHSNNNSPILGGSMTPQHHYMHNRRRHTIHHPHIYDDNNSPYHHTHNTHNNNNNYNKQTRIEKIYNLLQQHGNKMKLSTFTQLYPSQFHEMLPSSSGRDNNLLKYLVQLPRILVIKCLSSDDIMIFCTETPAHRTVIDILRRDSEIFNKENILNKNNNNNPNIEYKGMAIDKFTSRLAEKLDINSLSDCNIIDFLARWRVVELVDNNKYVRLMPMGCCTVFLGNLNPAQWNENKVRNILIQINKSWYNLRIRLNKTNYGLLNAFVDFPNIKQAQNAINDIKNHLHLFENNNNNQQQQQQQQYYPHSPYGNQMIHQSHMNISHPQSPYHNTSPMTTMQSNNNNNNHNIRVEMEQASLHKNYSNNNNMNYHHSYYYQNQFGSPIAYNNNNNNNHNNHNNNSNNHNNNRNHNLNQYNQYKKQQSRQQHHPNVARSNPSTPIRGNHKSNNHNHNHHHNNNNNSDNFSKITNNIYNLIRSSGGKMLMSNISKEYLKLFGKQLQFDGNPKYFVKMERLLLLNCENKNKNKNSPKNSDNKNDNKNDKSNNNKHDDVMIFFTPEPAYKLVVTILKQNPSGLTVAQFKNDLESRMGMTLIGCDFNDFLMRWRFLSIREIGTGNNIKKMVLFTPHSGSTVFFGNLNIECNENDIYNDLELANKSWKHSSVRLKLGKGFAYAFVDFPTREDAMKAVQHFDGKPAFKSKYVSADIEAIEQRKRHHYTSHNNNNNNNNHNNHNNNKHNNYRRQRSSSHGNFNNNNNNQYNNYRRNSYNNRHNNNNNNHYNDGNHSPYHSNNNHISSLRNNKTTVYLGNLRDDVTKNDIQNELAKFNSSWNNLTIRLNLRSGWSHAFVDFELSNDARKLINAWNNRPNSLTMTRLRCEISKRQM